MCSVQHSAAGLVEGHWPAILCRSCTLHLFMQKQLKLVSVQKLNVSWYLCRPRAMFRLLLRGTLKVNGLASNAIGVDWTILQTFLGWYQKDGAVLGYCCWRLLPSSGVLLSGHPPTINCTTLLLRCFGQNDTSGACFPRISDEINLATVKLLKGIPLRGRPRGELRQN